jgi:ribosomal protein S18 acetylase RimI-like enzyme
LTEWSIQTLERPQLTAAAASLVDAFAADPMPRYMQPNDQRRVSFNRWFFEKTLNYGLMWGEAWTDLTASGAAVWLRPGETEMTGWRVFRAGFATLPFRVGFGGLSRFNHLEQITGRMRRDSVMGPYWYLLVLGVAPTAQGTGLGSALIEAGTRRADSDGVPCYLETETAQNVEFYHRRGFAVTSEAEIAPGFTMWSMRRDPR